MKNIATLIIFINCLITNIMVAQTGSIQGTVKTSDGKPAEYVNIELKEVKRGTITTTNGYYEIKNIPVGNYTVVVSYVGLAKQENNIEIKPNETITIDFLLEISEERLQEVVVTGNRKQYITYSNDMVAKMPLKNLENAQVYTTITKDLLQQQLAYNVDDALKNAPGVTKAWDATNRVGYGGTWLVSRGFTTQPKARNGLAGNVITSADAANIERIEVIKGPSATLFGSIITSYGGLINRVTKKPYSYFGGTVDYLSGSYGLNRIAADINTPLDKDGKILLRTNAVFSKQNSFQDYGYSKSFSFAPSLSYQPNNRLTINFDAEITNSENSGGSQIIYFITPSFIKNVLYSALSAYGYPDAAINAVLAGAPSNMQEAYGTNRADELKLDYDRSYLSNDLINKTFTANYFGEIKYQLSRQWTAQTLLSSGTTNSNGSLPYFYILPNMLPTFVQSLSTGAPSFGTAGHDYMARMVWRSVGDDRTTQIQQNFIGDFEIGKFRNRFVGGLDYYRYDARIAYNRFVGNLLGFPFEDVFDLVNTSGTVPNYYHLNEAKVDSAFSANPSASLHYNSNNAIYSAFIHDVFNVTNRLILSAGLRVDHFTAQGAYDAVNNVYNNGYDQTQLAPKFGIIYHPVAEKVALFANYQSGFTNKTGVDSKGNIFKPEQAYQWEGGVKLNLLSGKLSSTISYYDILVKDVVRTDVNNPLFNVQDGEQQSKGIEVELIATPMNGLNIIAGYAYNDSKFTKADAEVEGLRPATTGSEHSVNIWAAYRFSNPALEGLSIGFGGNYVGESYTIHSNIDGAFILPAYTLLNGLIAYDHSHFRIAAKVNNITNEHYWVGWTTINPQMPRQFIGSVAFKF